MMRYDAMVMRDVRRGRLCDVEEGSGAVVAPPRPLSGENDVGEAEG